MKIEWNPLEESKPMTPRCSVCGEFESQQTSVDAKYDTCRDCITNLIETEIERRGNGDEPGIAGGQSGDSQLAHIMSESQKVK